MRGSGLRNPILADFDDVIEQHHHLGDIERAAAGAADRVGGQVVGDAAGPEFGLDALQRLDHFRPQVARQQRQHLAPANLGAERQRFRREQLIERLDIDLGALEFRPGIFQVIGGVGAPDDVGGQPAFGLEP